MAKNKLYNSWDYRVVRDIDKGGNIFHSIRDVYYNKKNEPTQWGAEPQYPIGEKPKDLRVDMIAMKRALLKPILVVVGNKLVRIDKII